MKWYVGNNFPVFDGDGWVPETWNKLKEPRPEWMNVLAIPVGIIMLGCVLFLWTLTQPEIFSKEYLKMLFSRSMLLILPALILPHELIHLVLHPSMGRTQYSILGFIPKHFLFFAGYIHEWSCRRFAACLAAPFLCISLLPTLLAFLGLPIHPLLIQASLINAFISSGDIIGLVLLVSQVPGRSIVRNHGFQSYWSQTKLTSIE